MEIQIIEMIEYILSYQFQNKALLVQAFTRSSYANEHKSNDNEVLEFLGDTILGHVVVLWLFQHHTILNEDGLSSKLRENSFTELKSKLVNGRMLASRIDKLGLASYLIVGEGDKKINAISQSSVKECLFEAIVGAVAIDSCYNQDILNSLVNVMLNIEETI